MKSRPDGQQALILEIQRMSTEDGPGLRTTLFLKGCPLCCPWCHNPESISFEPQLEWIGARCIGCHTCVSTCVANALKINPRTHEIMIDWQVCDSCGLCVRQCPTNALKMIGTLVNLEEISDELLKDSAYLKKSVDGGITISGGEATCQAAFVNRLFERIHENGLGTALDTSGFCPSMKLQEAAINADLILYDLKLADAEKHKRIVGGDLGLVLDNLALLIDMGKRIWLRTPIIPGFTNDLENITGIAWIILQLCETHGQDWFERWELCAFNNLCSDKYARLGKSWIFTHTPLMNRISMEKLVASVIAQGLPKEKVSWTGMTELEGYTS